MDEQKMVKGYEVSAEHLFADAAVLAPSDYHVTPAHGIARRLRSKS